MSASVQPFSKAARGRLPIRPWMRVVLTGVIILGVVFVVTWIFVLPGSQKPPAPSTGMWSAGSPMKLPSTPDTPATASNPSPAPSADTPVPGPAPVQLVRPMHIWGGESGAGGFTGQRNRPVANVGDRSPSADDGNPNTELAQRLAPTATRATEAEVDSDISLLLPEGTTFGCIPLSPMDTQLVGSVTCSVDEDVMSTDGANRLIDKGAFVTGEIQRGLGLGQDRAFILWHRVRSGHVRAVLDSPGVDELGEMGVPGIVDEHLWQKIKATVLLTGIEGLGQAGENLANRGNGNSYVNFSNGQSLAQTALQHDITVPTTLWRGQAWPLRIRVEHDVWFRHAYGDVLVAGSAR